MIRPRWLQPKLGRPGAACRRRGCALHSFDERGVDAVADQPAGGAVVAAVGVPEAGVGEPRAGGANCRPRSIAEAGFELHVWARRPASLDDLADAPHVPSRHGGAAGGGLRHRRAVLRTYEDVQRIAIELPSCCAPAGILVNHGTSTATNAGRLPELCAEGASIVPCSDS
jgi:hypothetical protein